MKQLSLPLNYAKNVGWFQQILTLLGINISPGWPDKFGLAIRNWLAKNERSSIKTLSLFTGGGGLDIAFQDCGFDIVQMVEIEPKYVRTLESNSHRGKWLENSQPTCIDIREYFPPTDLEIDFIIGGPPCQTFSAAARRAAGVTGTNDPRGTLFNEYVRILKMLQPKGFLFENVYGIIGAQKGTAWQNIKTAFQEAGYTLYYRVIDAADYGVPQHRERLFIVGLKQGNYLFPSPTHGPDSPGQQPFYSAGEAVKYADVTDAEFGICGRYGHLLEDIPPGLNYSFYTEKMGHPHPVFSWRSKFSDFLYKADPEMPVKTLKAQGGQYTGPLSWENRRFTLAELKRLQTIPDAYELVGNRLTCIEQIGNSVPPQLGRILALSILDQIMGVKLPFPMHYLPPDRQLGFRQRKRQLTQKYAEKAKAAILKIYPKKPEAFSTSNGYCQKGEMVRFLSSDFAWKDQEIKNSISINLRYEIDLESWTIEAKMKGKPDRNYQYCIEILPREGFKDWALATNKVRLFGKDLDFLTFTALWKGFEEKAMEITGKADLVQLSGYYQYKPRIKGLIIFNPQLKVDSIWRVIASVVGGIGVASKLSAEDLAILWKVNADDVFGYLQHLRTMGYEVRNHKTNPQIALGEYLIPYSFPTLTPKSVQLRKSLG
jgi:DNA (cytosine-5)-methyltransferase 1